VGAHVVRQVLLAGIPREAVLSREACGQRQEPRPDHGQPRLRVSPVSASCNSACHHLTPPSLREATVDRPLGCQPLAKTSTMAWDTGREKHKMPAVGSDRGTKLRSWRRRPGIVRVHRRLTLCLQEKVVFFTHQTGVLGSGVSIFPRCRKTVCPFITSPSKRISAGYIELETATHFPPDFTVVSLKYRDVSTRDRA